MNELEKKIYELTEPICAELNLELVEVNFKKEFGELILEVLIDKDTYVSTDDTTAVSEKLGLILDELDLIKDSYTLEVSSVGLEKELKNESEILKSIGKYIHVDLKEPLVIGKKQFTSFDGTLLNLKDEELSVEVMDKTRKVELRFKVQQIKYIRLAVKF